MSRSELTACGDSMRLTFLEIEVANPANPNALST